jgi:hypothetical protein
VWCEPGTQKAPFQNGPSPVGAVPGIERVTSCSGDYLGLRLERSADPLAEALGAWSVTAISIWARHMLARSDATDDVAQPTA